MVYFLELFQQKCCMQFLFYTSHIYYLSQPSDCSHPSYVTYTHIKNVDKKSYEENENSWIVCDFTNFCFSLQWQKCAEPEVGAAEGTRETQGAPSEERAWAAEAREQVSSGEGNWGACQEAGNGKKLCALTSSLRSITFLWYILFYLSQLIKLMWDVWWAKPC